MTEIVVEVRPPAGYAGDLAGAGDLSERFSARADEIADSVEGIARAFRGRLDELMSSEKDAWTVGEVQISFALALKAESGVIIAKAGAEATFTATITWNRR